MMDALVRTRERFAFALPERTGLFWLTAGLALLLLLQLPVVLHRAINWDEFYHYSQVVKLAQGTLAEPLQTLYTRAFVWVPALPGTGVDHIVLIRLFMLACELVTLAAIVGIATRFTDRAVGLLCAIAYLSIGFVFKHGTSFRFDPPATALLMTSAWILLRSKLGARAILLAGLLAGISAVLTLKTIFYGPIFAGFAWLRWVKGGRRREDLVWLAALALTALVVAGCVYLLHSATLAAGSGEQAKSLVSRAGSSMFVWGNPLYRWHALEAALNSPLPALIALAAPVLIWREKRPASEKVALTGLWLPFTTLLFYQNTAPYYYTFMMAPVMTAAAPAFALLARRWGHGLVMLPLLFCAGIVLMQEPESPIDRQRQILAQAERMFPGGVAYFDNCAMLGTFPKANVFMTPWGIEHYLAGHLPSMVEAMERQPVPLLVNNEWMFERAMETKADVDVFLPQDLAAMRDTYVPLWGPLWIAGREVGHGSATVWTVRVPGPYIAEWHAMIVDGRRLARGAVIRLDRGRHRLQAEEGDARLLWGDRPRTPSQAAPPPPYFSAF